MTRGLRKRKTPPVHRISLTHGQEGIPKFLRENTEQFFAKATSRGPSTAQKHTQSIMSSSVPQLQPKDNNIKGKYIENLVQTTSTAKPSTSVVVLPPIETENNYRQKVISSPSVRIHQTTLLPLQSSSNDSSKLSTPILKLVTPPNSRLQATKRQFRHGGPVDADIFRKAYDRALSVARSRLLFADPYSFGQASSTHGLLYSYYDHTPTCVFSRGTDCNHKSQNTPRKENFRKKIFQNVVVENYIR